VTPTDRYQTGHDQCSALVDPAPAPARRLHTVGGGAAARRSVITGGGGVTKMAAAAHSSIAEYSLRSDCDQTLIEASPTYRRHRVNISY